MWANRVGLSSDPGWDRKRSGVDVAIRMIWYPNKLGPRLITIDPNHISSDDGPAQIDSQKALNQIMS